MAAGSTTVEAVAMTTVSHEGSDGGCSTNNSSSGSRGNSNTHTHTSPTQLHATHYHGPMMSADVRAIATGSDCRVLRPTVPKKPTAQRLQLAHATSQNQRIWGTQDTGGNGRAGCAGSNIGELHELLGRDVV